MNKFTHRSIDYSLIVFVSCFLGTNAHAYAADKVLNGSAKESQNMSSAVKLFKRTDVPKAPTRPQTAVVPQIKYAAVDPNAPVRAFNRVRHLGPDGRDLPVRPIAPVASLNAATSVSDPASNLQNDSGGSNLGNASANLSHLSSANRTVSPLAVQKLPSATPLQLKSSAKLLTEPDHQTVRSINWDDWYKRVCQTVYDQWMLNHTGPGKACVQVTVWSGRSIEGRVVNFKTAPGAENSGTQQDLFAKAALLSVNSLENNSILDFPAQDPRSKIVFDMDITRLVGGASGCQVVNLQQQTK